MKVFNCDACGALVFFENVSCLSCGHALGFLPDIMDMAALEADGAGGWKSLAATSSGRHYRACANGQKYSVCNWFIPVEEADNLCAACRLNSVVPDDTQAGNHARWHKAEIAKRRLIYTLLRLGLPTEAEPGASLLPLRFRFLADVPGSPPVLTGHENGLITLNIAEADDVERETRRVQLFEPQRTLVGHFRHESGHYYWDALIASSPLLNDFRALFGDERADYAEALQRYYANGPAADWTFRCISAYASAHPWEDWAETWAHYLHMVDSLETAAGFGLSLRPRHPSSKTLSAEPGRTTEDGATFETLLINWFPLTHVFNSINRGLGLPDLYPFVLSPAVIQKLRFIHNVISGRKTLAETDPEVRPAELLQMNS